MVYAPLERDSDDGIVAVVVGDIGIVVAAAVLVAGLAHLNKRLHRHPLDFVLHGHLSWHRPIPPL